ncbi:MucB/RseB C-terminal domain-containing protein [Halomonas sp. AOP42-D2-25]|uniref:MucB/RseB C-terminal domain-containing protein n=1 Tax=unclassified Halomonas TaxID=2609666 RepID=UPI00403391C7
MMVPRRAKHAWALRELILVMALGVFPLQAQAQGASTPPQDQQGYECLAKSQDAPNSEIEWLERGLWASHCYAFQARAVAIDAVGVRTLALSHRIKNGIRQQVVQYLDGPTVSIERRSPVGRLAWTEENVNSEQPSPARWAAHLSQHYTIELEDNARVAGRDAVKLVFEPLDQWRFSHQWWLDRETGLLLKHVLTDQQGRVIETFQITQLQSPEQYAGSVRVDTPSNMPAIPWNTTWLPGGFVAQPVPLTGNDDHQRVYSDGLATVSLFVEPISTDAKTTLEEGVQQLGVSAVAIEHYASAEGRWQLVAIGELPVTTLQRIVRSITFDAAPPPDTDDHNEADSSNEGEQ